MMGHGMRGMMCPRCGGRMGFGPKMAGLKMKMLFKILPWKIMMHSEELGLSEQQVDSLRTRHAEALKQMIQIMSQIKMNKVDLHAAVMKEEIDMQTAEARAREIGKLKGDLMVAMIQAMNDMRKTLTHEQRMRVKGMIMSWFKGGGMPSMEEGEGEEEEGEEGESE